MISCCETPGNRLDHEFFDEPCEVVRHEPQHFAAAGLSWASFVTPMAVIQDSKSLEERGHVLQTDGLGLSADRITSKAGIDNETRLGFRSSQAMWKPFPGFGDSPRLISIAHRPWPGVSKSRSISAPAAVR